MSPLDDSILDAEALTAPVAPSPRGRAIAASTLWQVASQFVMAVLSVITVKFVAIGLQKELVGYYNSAYGYLQTFAILADFGLYAVSIRELSKAAERGGGEEARVFGALFLLRTVIVILSFGAALAIVWALPLWRGTPFPLGVSIASLVPVFTLLAGMIRTIFQMRYKMHFVFVAEVLQRIFTTAGIGFFIVAGTRLSGELSVYEWFLWIGGIGAFLLFLVSYLYALRFQRVSFCFDRALLRKLIVLAAPYGVAYLLLTLYRQLDVVFIALLRPDFALQNASYGLAGRVEDMAFLLPTFVLNSILPVLSRGSHEDPSIKALLGRTFFALLLLGSMLFLYSLFWAVPLTHLFATEAYLSVPGHAGADVAFALLSAPMFLNGVVLFCFYVFLAHHRWKRLIAAFSASVLLTVVLNLLLTKPYGFVGAATALIITHVLLAIVLLPQALRLVPISFTLKQFFQWLAFSAALALVLLVSAPYLHSALRCLVGGVLTLPILVFLAFFLGIHRSFLKEKNVTEAG